MRAQILRLLTISAVALMITSCFKERSSIAVLPAYNNEQPIELTFSIPSNAASRAMSETDENEIGIINVLAFFKSGSDYRFGYYAKEKSRNIGSIALPTPGRQLKLTVEARGYALEQCFVVLANASDELAQALSSLPVGQTLENVMAKIVSTKGAGEWIDENGNFAPIPMYAKTNSYLITADMDIGKIPHSYPLIRMLARVDIRLKEGIDNFELEEAMLYNHKTAGFVSYEFSDFKLDIGGTLVTPDGTNEATEKGSRVTKAAVPPDSYNSNYDGDPIVPGTVTYLADNGEFISTIYAFESPAYTEEDRLTGTAIIIGGKYNGSDDITYYRINLKLDDDTSDNASSHILRNHLYNVVIKSVSSPGYETEEDAYMGGSEIEIYVGLQDWDNCEDIGIKEIDLIW